MTVPDGAVLRVSTRWNGPVGQDIVNVWSFLTDFTAPQDDSTVVAALNTYLSGVFVEFDDDLVTAMTPEDIKCDVIDFIGGKWVVTANVGFGSWGGTLTTTETADTLPHGASAVAFLQTSLGKHQGRKFFGGFGEDQNSPSGAVGSDVITRIMMGLVKLLTPHVISAGNELIAVVLDTVDGTIREVVSTAVNTQWGYQRRRRLGVGS